MPPSFSDAHDPDDPPGIPDSPAPHRKTVKHYEVPGQPRLLTFSCYRRLPLLLDESRRQLLGDAVAIAAARLNFVLSAFVFMPEHVHLIVTPWGSVSERTAVPQLLFAIKRPTSFRIKQQLETADDPLAHQLRVVERPGKVCFRFWQEGPGHDRNLRTSDAMAAAIGYVHRNPVERGLCARPEDWKWSSAGQYLPEQEAVTGVPRVVTWSRARGFDFPKTPQTSESGNEGTHERVQSEGQSEAEEIG